MTTPRLPVEATEATGTVGASSARPSLSNSGSSRFVIGESEFMLDGEPFRVLAGALHYFRVHPDQWADRIRKARQMGLNTIETYIPWNAHAPRRGSFDLGGGLDLGRFLDLVAAEGMRAIVRPGPYICGEWAGGGLPAWLFREPGVQIRRDEPRYMEAVAEYFAQFAPVIVPRQLDQDGPIILVQVENEYGAYGDDKAYLRRLVELNREIGVTVPLITVDQASDEMLENGGLPGLHRTGSFGSRIAERLQTLRRHQPDGPLMCTEFWNGWFDSWGGHHHVTSIDDTARHLDELLAQGASVNIYMFHGGTNFGLLNGANDKGTYEPIVTSYDYDAPLDEAGNPTPKYWALRDVLARHGTVEDAPPAHAPAAPTLSAPLREIVPLWDVAGALGELGWHDHLPTADELGHHQGFTLYRADLDVSGPAVLELAEVRDRAQVFLDRQGVGVLERHHHDHAIVLPASPRGTLELLVEDQGRVDYGPRLGEPKGLIAPAAVNGAVLRRWGAQPLELDDISRVAALLDTLGRDPAGILAGPAFARARFDLEQPADLFLDTSGWGKGVVWMNGFCLGRYWSRGPQRTLYVPAPVLRHEGNELIVFELHASTELAARFVSGPELGHTER
jgi:beta-galactosidase